MTTGRLIILEGPDGAGKSTTAKALVEMMRADGMPAQLFAFPGNEPGTLGRLVHDLHHQPETHGIHSIDPTSLQILHAAAHVDAIRTRIRPAFERGDTVIMDRFWWSTIVYGRLAGVDNHTLEVLDQLARHHWGFAVPTTAFVLLGPSMQASDVQGDGSRLRRAYSDFVGSLNAPFPVHSFEYEQGNTPYAERILVKIAELRRSSSP
ncbi:MAG: hypothetical protein KF787_08850 [Phycisphaeraceae bacterium]|nr:hypothetical protein [Phycisphaeraceae bacterium]